MVSSVDRQNQGRSCGSCYAFVTASVVESHFAIVHKTPLVKLSVQQIIDCSGQERCRGGDLRRSLEYVQKFGGLNSALNYPYIARNQNCRASNRPTNIYSKISGYEWVKPRNEHSIADYIYHKGPVASVICVNDNFKQYTEGIFNLPCERDNHNHVVLIVGYGVENGIKYWKIKNTWGTGWGEEGYFRMLRGDNHCGILKFAIIPIVTRN
jgi:C1A family cysteine protease